MIKHFKELYRYRDLLITLAIRDIKVRYRQSFLGVAWAIVQPLAFMLVFNVIRVVMFSSSGAKITSDGIPYPVFSYTGLVPWIFFSSAVTLAINSVAANMSLVKKIYFPREVFPIGVIMGSFLDFCVASLLVGVLMLIYHVPLSMTFLWLPWLIGLEIAFLITIALFASAANVFYRDVKYIMPLVVQLGMFISPVIYSVSRVPEHLLPYYMLNPMAVVIDGVRRVVLQGLAPRMEYLLLSTAIVGVCGILSYKFFKSVEIKFADLI